MRPLHIFVTTPLPQVPCACLGCTQNTQFLFQNPPFLVCCPHSGVQFFAIVLFCQLCSALAQHHHETFNLMLSLLPAISQQVKIIFLTYPPVDTIKSPRQKLTGSVTILSTNSTLFMACKDIYDSKIPATERIILDQALAVKVHRFYMLRYPQTNSRQVFPLPSQECAQILHAQSVF